MKIWRRGELTYGRRELLVLHRGDNAEGTLDVAHLGKCVDQTVDRLRVGRHAALLHVMVAAQSALQRAC